MYKVDLSYTWKYWEEHILPIVQEFGAYKSHIRRLGEYEFEYRCGKEAWKFEQAVHNKMKELLDISNGALFPNKWNELHSTSNKQVLSKEWNEIGLTWGPGGIHCPCCAPPSAERKAEFRSRFRMNNKKIIQNELKEFHS